MFCTNCGSKLPEGARFCSVCGVRVAETEPEEKVVSTPLDLDFSDVKPAEAPVKTRVTFDWSNVIDEPHRKKTETIKSPWSATGSVDEKEIFTEMTPSTDRSRTMSFIDVLKAEKEQQNAQVEEAPVEEPVSALEEMIAEDSEQAQGIDYTEVLDPGFLSASTESEEVVENKEFVEPEMPDLHIPPLFKDVDEPVKTPFDVEESVEAQDTEFEEPEFEEPVLSLEDLVEKPEEPQADWFEMPAFLQSREDDRPAFEDGPEIEAHEVEIPSVEKNVEEITSDNEEEAVEGDDSAITESYTAEEPEEVEAAEEVVDEYDDYMNIETEERVGRGHRSEQYESELDDYEDDEESDDENIKEDDAVEEDSAEDVVEPETYDEIPEYEEDFDEDEEPAELAIDSNESDEVEETEEEEAPVEEEIFSEMELPKHAGMTIAAPADRESEIEALKARLAELMGMTEEPEIEVPKAEDAEAVETIEDIEDAYLSDEAFTAAVSETPATAEEAEAVEESDVLEEVVEPEGAEISEEPSFDDILAAVLKDASVPAEETVADVSLATEMIDTPEVPEMPEVPEGPVVSEAVEVVEEAEPEAEPEAEEVTEEPVAEEAAPEKETDALTLEDLERDLFGVAPEDDAEAEVTKKIDKFYTLYRKNEEFQRLLDEEYTKLKVAGGETPEPVLPELEPQRPVEDATIYQPLDRPLEEIAKEEAAKAAAAKGEVKSDEKNEAKPVIKAEEKPVVKAAEAAIPVAAVAGTAAAVATEAQTQGPEVEYEEVDKGGTFLTVLAVIIALLLVVLLAVILILNFASDSGAAIWIDSIIENITSHFTVVDGGFTQYYL